MVTEQVCKRNELQMPHLLREWCTQWWTRDCTHRVVLQGELYCSQNKSKIHSPWKSLWRKERDILWCDCLQCAPSFWRRSSARSIRHGCFTNCSAEVSFMLLHKFGSETCRWVPKIKDQTLGALLISKHYSRLPVNPSSARDADVFRRYSHSMFPHFPQ